MENGILATINKMLGNVDGAFDTDVIIHINSAFATLRQLGIGPTSGFSITGSNEVWGDFVESSEKLNEIQQYVYISVKIIFDPPQNSASLSALKEAKAELEWRLSVEKI